VACFSTLIGAASAGVPAAEPREVGFGPKPAEAPGTGLTGPGYLTGDQRLQSPSRDWDPDTALHRASPRHEQQAAGVPHTVSLRALKQAGLVWAGVGQGDAEVAIRELGGYPSPRRPRQKPELDQVRLVHVFDRLGLL